MPPKHAEHELKMEGLGQGIQGLKHQGIVDHTCIIDLELRYDPALFHGIGEVEQACPWVHLDVIQDELPGLSVEHAEIEGPAVEGGHLRFHRGVGGELGDDGDPFRQWCIRSHSRGDVDDQIRFGPDDPDRLLEQFRLVNALTGQGISHVQMNDGGPCFPASTAAFAISSGV